MKKIFIIAGEASGDYLGGKLMDDIRSLYPDGDFFGIGGECMRRASLREFFSIDRLSIIGIFEIIGKIFQVRKMINDTVSAIVDYNPDVLITIDSSGFTHRVAKKVKSLQLGIKIVHYVSPPVWAWRKWRAKHLHKFIDRLLVLLPFEAEIFKKYDMDTVFVGHPVATDSDLSAPEPSKLENFAKLYPGKNIVLLPGSRASEINKHLPIFGEFTELLLKKYKNVNFFIPTIESLEEKILKITKNWKQKPIVTVEKSQKVLAYYSSHLAVAASGTVTLELARVGLPSVVIYKTSAITAAILRCLVRIKHVCLVNILAGKTVIPELLQKKCDAKNIFNCAERLLDNSHDEASRQKKEFSSVVQMLVPEDPKRAAKEIIELLGEVFL